MPNPDPFLAEMAAAYVRNNAVQPSDVPNLIAAVHGALAGLGQPEPAAPPDSAKLAPPVPTRKTVTDEHIISLEDGKPYKALKRHLGRLGLTPEAYRAKWGLPHDYPMTAPAYARMRSEFAKASGLGRKR